MERRRYEAIGRSLLEELEVYRKDLE